ncbi:penicillin-binding protein [Bacillus sp. HMF5848]|uniref:transglycosylase domain-containing protein n=1 Tax=Bacillus sp. HMF5848 TaxID=2495421 RepID=UPI000F77DB8C|nr:transglycosylase domain-containing protein [Bacillus sp. HMF5848]RSK28192.1 penicillin-binding protein [Bacillus sp. HMF5848]
MKDTLLNWLERLQQWKSTLNNPTIIKSYRITYQVIWNLLLIFIVFGLILLSFGGGVGAGYFASLVKDEPIRAFESMEKDIYNYEETTELFFANNQYLGKLRSDLDREEARLQDVSPYVIDALIATEDEYFWEHNGVVPKAIFRALLQEATNSGSRSGGSTLTQQLIKLQILTNEVTFDRKAKEMLLALRLEQFFKKEQILEAYLNVATFGRNSSGRNIAGVQTAAQGIFGIDAKDLNLAQSAYIAGMVQSPSRYTPFKNNGELKSPEGLQYGLNRLEYVLSRMLKEDKITNQQYQSALNYDIVGNLATPKKSPIEKYPYLTMEIELRAKEILAEILAERDGYQKSDLDTDDKLRNEYFIKADRNMRQNGYRIFTTIDKDIYDKMQVIKNEYDNYGEDKPQAIINSETGEEEIIMEPVEVGAMLIENKTGKIISFVGGRDYNRSNVNHATDAWRSNGSTMKPLAVYAPAIELGKISPGTVIPDVQMNIQWGDSDKGPNNYDYKFHGLTSARYALQQSYNIPAIRTYMSILDQRPAKYLQKMGFSRLTEEDYYIPSLAIGSMNGNVSVEENTNAYVTFANGGKFIDAYMIEKIETKDGEVIYEHEITPVTVFSEQTAFLTLDMMRDVVLRGTAADIPGRLNFQADWAGKTGTGHNFYDAWFVATNPNVTFGIWNGYDHNKPLNKSLYSRRNKGLWADLINGAYEINPELIAPKERFKMPGGIVQRSYCAVSGLLPSDLCKEADLIETDMFTLESIPTEVDDNLIEGSYVRVNGEAYAATETTPEDFIQTGLMINPEYLIELELEYLEDSSQLLPNRDKWANIVVPKATPLEENGKVPAILGEVKISDNQITWPAHPEQDIIGYRVFSLQYAGADPQLLASIVADGDELSYTLPSNAPAAYYVIPVDILGQMATEYDLIKVGSFDTQKPEPEEPIDPIDEEEPPSDEDNPEDEENEDTPEEGNNDDPGSLLPPIFPPPVGGDN